MKLFTKKLLKKIPKIGETEGQNDPIVWAKLFYPDFSWTWYVIEFDGEDICFGYVKGFENELGYFSLKELQRTRGKLGCKIERDLYFKPKPLSQIMKERD